MLLAPISVTILTGFLGAGKTTLINNLLKNSHGEKIAVIENEFGEVNIDKELLCDKAAQIIELEGGCVCCSIRGELSSALKSLVLRLEKGEFAADRFVLETTGVADPAPIIQTFFADEMLREKFVLDAVVTVVSAKHIQKQLLEHRVCASQIGFADRIILTKTDLVSKSEKEEIIARLHDINKKAVILEALNAELEKEAWIGIGGFEMDGKAALSEGFYRAQNSGLKFVKFSPRQIKSYDENISSFVLEADELDFDKTDAFLEALIEEFGNDMLRYKGILAIKGEKRRLIIQGVHKVAGFDWGEECDKRRSSLVIIGRGLAKEEIKRRFLQCAV